jgi:hypothetical protein
MSFFTVEPQDKEKNRRKKKIDDQEIGLKWVAYIKETVDE